MEGYSQLHANICSPDTVEWIFQLYPSENRRESTIVIDHISIKLKIEQDASS